MLNALFLAILIGGGDGTVSTERSAAISSPEAQTPAASRVAGEQRSQSADGVTDGGIALATTSTGPQVGSTTSNQLGPIGEYGGDPQLTIYTVKFLGGPLGTATGFKEFFMVATPSQDKPRPMLVGFHKFSVSHKDLIAHTKFFEEATARGWHVLAPLSAAGVNMSSTIGQRNTELAMEWMVANFNIDRERIYGVGFSMGGGTLMSYAARHVDPARPMFAAVLDHSGGVALNDVHLNEPTVEFIFDFWYGNGSPGSASPWKMRASSLFDFNPSTLQVDRSSDMARNLEYLPTFIFRVADDPLLYLSTQSDVMAAHLAFQGTPVKYQIVPGPTHGWPALSERQTLSWLSKKRLTLPLSGRILADRDEKFFHFTVTQTVPLVFSKLNWSLDLQGNILDCSNTANLTRVEVATAEAGLSSAIALQVDMDTTDPSPVEYVITNWPTAPSAVTRDGVPSVAFVYDPIGFTVTLQETVAGPHSWIITP